jgi:hypothetical protein
VACAQPAAESVVCSGDSHRSLSLDPPVGSREWPGAVQQLPSHLAGFPGRGAVSEARMQPGG